MGGKESMTLGVSMTCWTFPFPFLQTCANAPPGASVQACVCVRARVRVCMFRGVLTEVLGGSLELLCVSVPAGSWSLMTHTHTHTHTHTYLKLFLPWKHAVPYSLTQPLFSVWISPSIPFLAILCIKFSLFHCIFLLFWLSLLAFSVISSSSYHMSFSFFNCFFFFPDHLFMY